MVSETIEAWKTQRTEMWAASEMLRNCREEIMKIEQQVQDEIDYEASQMTERNNPLSNAEKRNAAKRQKLESNPKWKGKKEREIKIEKDLNMHRDNAEFFKMCFWNEFADKVSAGRVD